MRVELAFGRDALRLGAIDGERRPAEREPAERFQRIHLFVAHVERLDVEDADRADDLIRAVHDGNRHEPAHAVHARRARNARYGIARQIRKYEGLARFDDELEDARNVRRRIGHRHVRRPGDRRSEVSLSRGFQIDGHPGRPTQVSRPV